MMSFHGSRKDATPDDAAGFDGAMSGPDGFTMPATQSDLWLWFAGASYDIVWDSASYALDVLRGVATLDRELDGRVFPPRDRGDAQRSCQGVRREIRRLDAPSRRKGWHEEERSDPRWAALEALRDAGGK